MFESFSFKAPEEESKQEEIKIDYAEVAKNKKEIEERKKLESNKEFVEKLSEEIRAKEGVEKAKKELEKAI